MDASLDASLTVRLAREQLADALAAEGRHDEAIAELERCQGEDGREPPGWRLDEKVGDLLSGSQQPGAALGSYVRAVVGAGGGAAHARRRALDLLDDAVPVASHGVDRQLVDGLVELGPGAGAEVQLLAGLLARRRDAGSAVRCLEHAVEGELRPEDRRRAQLALMEVLLAEDRATDALRLADLATDLPSSEAAAAGATALVQLHRFDEAAEVLRSSPEAGDGVLMAIASLANGDAATALELLDRPADGAADAAEAALWLAVALLMARRTDEAVDAVDVASERAPSSSANLLVRAQVLLELAAQEPRPPADGVQDGTRARIGDRVVEARRLLDEVPAPDRDRHPIRTLLAAQQTGRDDDVHRLVRAEVGWAWERTDPRPVTADVDRTRSTYALDGMVDWLQALAHEADGSDAEAADLLSAAAASFRVAQADPELALELERRAAGLHDPTGVRHLRVVDDEVMASFGPEGQRAHDRAADMWERFRVLASDDVPPWAYTAVGVLTSRKAELSRDGRRSLLWCAVALLEAGGRGNSDSFVHWGHLSRAYNDLLRPLACYEAAEEMARIIERSEAAPDEWSRLVELAADINYGDTARAREVLATFLEDGPPPPFSWQAAVDEYMSVLEGDLSLPAGVHPPDEAEGEFAEPWHLASLALRVLVHHGLEESEPYFRALEAATRDDAVAPAYWAEAVAYQGRASEALDRLAEEGRRGNVGEAVRREYVPLILVLADRVDEAVRCYLESLGERTPSSLRYLLELELPSLVAARPSARAALDEVSRAVRAALDGPGAVAGPWLADLDPPDEDGWQRVARTVVRCRLGEPTTQEDRDQARDLLLHLLPPVMADDALRPADTVSRR